MYKTKTHSCTEVSLCRGLFFIYNVIMKYYQVQDDYANPHKQKDIQSCRYIKISIRSQLFTIFKYCTTNKHRQVRHCAMRIGESINAYDFFYKVLTYYTVCLFVLSWARQCKVQFHLTVNYSTNSYHKKDDTMECRPPTGTYRCHYYARSHTSSSNSISKSLLLIKTLSMTVNRYLNIRYGSSVNLQQCEMCSLVINVSYKL